MTKKLVVDDWGDDDGDGDDWTPHQWMSLNDAVEAAISSMGLSYIEAKANILELIADAKLPLRCQTVQEGADVGGVRSKVMSHRGQKGHGYKFSARPRGNPLPLKPNFFGAKNGWSFDPLRIDWQTGLLLATRPTEFEQSPITPVSRLTRRVAEGVLVKKVPPLVVNVPQPKSKMRDQSTPIPRPKTKRKGSTTLPTETFPGERALMEELLGRVRDGTISDFGGLYVRKTQSKIQEHIRILLTQPNGAEPSRSTLLRRAQEVMEAWRAKERSDSSS